MINLLDMALLEIDLKNNLSPIITTTG